MRKSNSDINTNSTYILSILLSLFVLILPWVCFKVQINASAEEKTVIPKSIMGVTDYFFAGKGILTILMAMVCLGFFIVFCIRSRSVKNVVQYVRKAGYAKIFACAIGYTFFVIISTVFSTYKKTAVLGNMNSCEGAIVLCSYMLIFVAACLIFKSEKSISIIEKTVLVLAMITTVLTLVEFFYRPIAQIIFPDGFSTDYVNMTSLTFYNPGYFGGFCILIFPVIGMNFVKAKKSGEILLNGLLVAFMIFSTITSRSTAAFYLLIFEIIIIAFILLIQKTEKRGIKIIAGIICSATVILVISIISNDKLLNVINSSAANTTTAIKSDSAYIISDITVIGNRVTLKGIDSEFVAEVGTSDKDGSSAIKFYDENNNLLNPDVTDGHIYFHDKYKAIIAYIENNALTIELGYKAPVHFYMHNNQFYPMLSDRTIVTNIEGNNIGLDRFYSIATGRGFFWVNSLPILKKTIILGHGPGTFELYFKQYDFVGLLNSQGTTDLVIDKPHSFYLQTATQTGLISMMLLVLLFVFVISDSIKVNYRYRKNENVNTGLLTGLTLGNFSYMIFMIANDSALSVNPVFWFLLGVNACIMQSIKAKYGIKDQLL